LGVPVFLTFVHIIHINFPFVQKNVSYLAIVQTTKITNAFT